MSRTAMQQALEALERLYNDTEIMVTWDQHRAMKGAITALKQALAEPEQAPISLNNGRLTQYPDGSIGLGKPAEPEQEPVAWMHPDGRVWTFGRGLDKSTFTIPLYTAPTPRKPLTDEELEPLCDAVDSYDITNYDLVKFARAIERAHGITGETK